MTSPSDPRDSATSEYKIVDPTPEKPWFQTPAGLATSVVGLLAVAVVGFILLSGDSNETVTEASVPDTTIVDEVATTLIEDTTSSTDMVETTLVEETATTVAETTTTVAPTTTALTVPPANGVNAWEVIRNSPDLSMFRRAIEDSDLIEVFQEVEAITVFAPSNDAFAALQAGVGGQAVLDDPDMLRALVLHHVTIGAIPTADLFALSDVTTSNDDKIVIGGGAMTVGGAKIVVADVAAGPSLLHVVDQVLLPE